jgi:hypothetical protein
MSEGDIAVYPSKQDRHSAGFCQTNDVFSAESLHQHALAAQDKDGSGDLLSGNVSGHWYYLFWRYESVRRDRTAPPFARYARCPAREMFTFSTRPDV